MSSVLDQSYAHLELIVVDDGSTDSTGHVLAAVRDPRLRVLTFSGSHGAPAARNAGVRAAAGQLVGFQDSDDQWTPDRLAQQVSVLVDAPDEVGVVYGMTQTGQGTGHAVRTVPGPCDLQRSGDLRTVLAAYNIIGLPTALIRIDLLEAVGGFDERLQRFQDWDLFLSLAEICHFAFVDSVFLHVGQGGDRITMRRDSYAQALGILIDKHADAYQRAPSALVALLMQIAAQAVRDRDLPELVRRVSGAARHPVRLADWAARTGTGRPRVIDRDRC